MTMFSQKAPFNLADFLSKPASGEARRLMLAAKRKFPASAEVPEEDATIQLKKSARKKR